MTRDVRSTIYSAVLLLPAFLCASASTANIYERPLCVTYAVRNTPVFKYTDHTLLAAFDQVEGGITSIVPFFLNVADVSPYDSLLKKMNESGIVIVPGLGDADNGLSINNSKNVDVARGYAKYTKYIQLENVQQYYDQSGVDPIESMIDTLVNELHFEHIQLNTWPLLKDGSGAVQFSNTQYIDSTINQVDLSINRNNYTINDKPNNWLPNYNKIQQILALNSSLNVLINYENPPQSIVLRDMQKEYGNSTKAFQLTIDSIAQSSEPLNWCPPFVNMYDPLKLKTWPYITSQLGMQ